MPCVLAAQDAGEAKGEPGARRSPVVRMQGTKPIIGVGVGVGVESTKPMSVLQVTGVGARYSRLLLDGQGVGARSHFKCDHDCYTTVKCEPFTTSNKKGSC
jgi:hypothetical protein